MKKLKARRTTFNVDGIKEPCIIVGEDDAQVRISTCYHLIGENALFVTEILDGQINCMDEIRGDFNSLSLDDAREIAKRHSVYVY